MQKLKLYDTDRRMTIDFPRKHEEFIKVKKVIVYKYNNLDKF